MNGTSFERVLQFWFGDALDSAHAAAARAKLWFGRNPSFDEELELRFGALPDRAARGELAGWRATPRGTLALILLLDQFPRNLYRDDPRAFQYDHLAQSEARRAVASGIDNRLHPLESAFVYLPFEHAEDVDSQNRAVELFENLLRRAPEPMKPTFEEFADYARRHRELILRFGRFPHRNIALGRPSTPEEAAYLAAGGETFGGQKNE